MDSGKKAHRARATRAFQDIQFPANEWAKPAVVVGVARGIRNTGPALEPEPEIYATAWFQNSSTAHFAVSTQVSTPAAAAFLKQAVAELDPVLQVTIEPADDQVARHRRANSAGRGAARYFASGRGRSRTLNRGRCRSRLWRPRMG